MASSKDSPPDCRRQATNWIIWCELLPGLEEFLTITLASENLSHFAEERRQFFIERLDIVKLPPTLPPREGRVLSPELLKETEESSGVPTSHTTPDFAATQREISRSFVESNASPDEVPDVTETSPVAVVKLYDDIDQADSGKDQNNVVNRRPLSEVKPDKTSDDDSEDNEDNALYEIPVARQQLSAESNSQSYGADGSSIATAGSTEELADDVLDTTLVASPIVPPPLPPRRDIKFSDSGSRNSINFEDKPPELPFRPPLPKRNELNPRSDKSDRSEKSNNSDPELSADGDSTSYESFEEEEQHDADLMNKLSVQLPKKPKKKMALKKSKKLSRSRSSSQWEISAPFRKLENIDISGELYYKGKLRWNRRIVAISNGCLAMYKPDKDARPSLVIPLTGYEASVNEREGRKGFELKMVHPNADCHSFSVDFKDWAALWMEHINGCSKGQPPAKYHTHLARTFSGDVECGANATTSGSKLNISDDNSAELDYDEIEIGSDLRNELFIKEEDDCDSVKSSPVESLSSKITRKLVSRHFQSEKSPLHSKRRTLGHSPKSNPFSLSSKDRTISATVKDILRRRQRAMYTVQSSEPCVEVGRYTPMGDRPDSQVGQVAQEEKIPTSLTLPASALSLSRWDWKSVFYNWSMPLDQLILAFRRTDLTEPNSNLSTGSEGGSEDSLRSKIKGNKVMRMGSFAFRATQFFENIGKGTKSKKKSQTSGANFRHSGDFTGVRDGILEEPPTSNSTGNLVRSKANATSDSNLHSAFSGSESMFSLPPSLSVSHDDSHHWEGADETDDFVDVTHKGYLHIFSSFNKRRWGKRWCMVRENMFECYRSSCSKQCELNFLLKPCVLRRAIAETNSERGLMILESGREKITVEPLSKEEMGHWVRVLLIETSTPNVPAGLEEFEKASKNSDGDSSSVMSFTVLKQWDMDCLVPTKNPSAHDYDDPVETAEAVAKLQASSHAETETAFHSTTAQNNSSSDSMSQSVSISADTVNKINNSSPVYPKNKHATDSGFYSAKGTNSDSDSSPEAGDLDYAYAAQDSRSFYSSQHTSTFSKGSSPSSPGSVQESCLDKDFSRTETPVDHFHSNQLDKPSSSSQCVHLSHSSTPLSSSPTSHKLAMSTSESHLHMVSTSNSRNHGCLGQINDYCSVPPANLNMSKRHSKSASAVSKSSKSASSSLTVLSPSGEEYSVVLKRSERSSKSPESCGELNNSLSSTSNSESRTSTKHEDDEMHENDDNVFSFPYNYHERPCTLAYSDNESSYYEPICSLHSVVANETDQPVHLTNTHLSKLDCNTPQPVVTNSRTEDQPPPIPTSPIPDLMMAPPFSVNVSSSAHGRNLKTATSSLSKQPEYTDLSKTSKGKGKKGLNINTSSGARLSGSQQQAVSNGNIPASRVYSYGSDDVFLSCEPPLSPTSDAIAAVTGNPNATPDELKKMTELLRHKQSEIKRKRLAVHDKRQRVSSDEERLACEKEIATLERATEITELDIRTIQNQLDTVRGQTLETMKASQGKVKLLSKKRKAKKKS